MIQSVWMDGQIDEWDWERREGKRVIYLIRAFLLPNYLDLAWSMLCPLLGVRARTWVSVTGWLCVIYLYRTGAYHCKYNNIPAILAG